MTSDDRATTEGPRGRRAIDHRASDRRTIAERERALFELWQARRPRLVRDGLVDEAAYLASSPRVVLVLKEANDEGGGGWDLRGLLRREPPSRTWSNVARWARGLGALDRDLPWAEAGPTPTADERRRLLRPLGVVNLKKEPGGASSDAAEVRRYAREDADLLAEQLALYAPDLVVCARVGDVLAAVLNAAAAGAAVGAAEPWGWHETSRGLRYALWTRGPESRSFVVDHYHPQARYPAPLLYYGLLDGVRELFGLPTSGGGLGSTSRRSPPYRSGTSSGS